MGIEGRLGGEGAEGGSSLFFVGVLAVVVFILWWTCRRRRKPRGRRSLIAKFPIV